MSGFLLDTPLPPGNISKCLLVRIKVTPLCKSVKQLTNTGWVEGLLRSLHYENSTIWASENLKPAVWNIFLPLL